MLSFLQDNATLRRLALIYTGLELGCPPGFAGVSRTLASHSCGGVLCSWSQRLCALEEVVFPFDIRWCKGLDGLWVVSGEGECLGEGRSVGDIFDSHGCARVGGLGSWRAHL